MSIYKYGKCAVLLVSLLCISLLLSCSVSDKNSGQTSGTEAAVNTNRSGADKIIEQKVTATENCSFAIPSGDGVFTVSILKGSVTEDTQLNIAGIPEKLDGIMSTGFMLEQDGKVGEHMKVAVPATITYLQRTPIPEEMSIVRYSDDGKSYEPITSSRVKINGSYGMYAIVDGFSGYGLGKVTKAQIKAMADEQMQKGFVWVLEASQEYRVTENIEDAESIDINFHIKATSRRISENPDVDPKLFNLRLKMNGAHYGIFDVNTFAVSKEKAEIGDQKLPVVAGIHYADDNLKIRMMAEYRDLLAPLAPDDGMLAPLAEPALIAPEVIGYKGWGVANIRLKDYAGLGGENSGSSEIMLKIPLIISVREGAAKVYFTFPPFGKIRLDGSYIGKGVKEVAVPPDLKDPKLSYSPGKPADPPDSWESNLTPEDLLAGLTQNSDGSIIQKTGAGGIAIEYEPEEKEEDEEALPSIDEIIELFNNPESMLC